MGGKFHGIVGFFETVESAPDVWRDKITKRVYTGDIVKNVTKSRDADQVNPSIIMEDRISIIADPFAYEKAHEIRYVVVHGTEWKVTGVEFNRPRIILTIGSVYNHEQTGGIGEGP